MYMSIDFLCTRSAIQLCAGTHWFVFVDHYFFDLYVHSPPQNRPNTIISCHPKYLLSTNRNRKHDSLRASYCFYFFLFSSCNAYRKKIFEFILPIFIGT